MVFFNVDTFANGQHIARIDDDSILYRVGVKAGAPAPGGIPCQRVELFFGCKAFFLVGIADRVF